MNISTFYHTLKYLKFKQIYYRIYYKVRNIYRKKIGFKYKYNTPSNPQNLFLPEYLNKNPSYKEKNTFIFLNKEKNFKNTIDWNFKEYGKLWTYNLNYFDFLNQENVKKNEGLRLIKDFVKNIESIKDGLEPYPISLRSINWIKFISKYRILDKSINDNLYAQYNILLDNLEYHLLGNHLLENGFSLLFGAYFFQDEVLYNKARKILLEELEEQTLSDGAHFELSPMYHQILLERILDSINLVKNNDWKNHELLEFLEEKAKLMLSWAKNITFSNDNIPLFNDSVFGIAPTIQQLEEYAYKLGINPGKVELGESGYRFIRKKNYEMAIDIADVRASYIPGHTHADTFTFELYVDNKPIIVDTGVSTYENCERRILERSTKAHNTVEIENTNSSEIWGSFRLGERAKVIELNEKTDYLKAIHDGYLKRFNVLHQREFYFKEDEIWIFDKILKNKEAKAVFYLHFHPDIKIKLEGNRLLINKKIVIEIDKLDFKLEKYFYAPEFNKLLKSNLLKVCFSEELKCKIKIKN